MIKSYEDKNINYELLKNLKGLNSCNYFDNIKEDNLLDIYGKGIMYYNTGCHENFISRKI